MELAYPFAAVTATIAGSACLYLGAPRQQWLARPRPARPSRMGGFALLILGWLIWCVPLRPVTAFFVVLTVGMLTLVVLPAVAALTQSWRRGQS